MVVIFRHPGTAPPIINHASLDDEADCDGMMMSAGFPAEDSSMWELLGEPTHEWFRPVRREWRQFNTAARQYAKTGGLFIRRIP